ncbi:MAG: helicase [Gemmatimonadetes bacterium]|nr:helicase [Gemmatimonadota bacterium]
MSTTTIRSLDTAILDSLSVEASDKIIVRALDLLKRGRIDRLSAKGDRIEARVSGSSSRPYPVTVSLTSDGIAVDCGCPFDWEPICKHGAAVILAASDEREVARLAGRIGGEEAGRDDEPDGAGTAETGAESYLAIREQEIAVRVQRGRHEKMRIRRIEGGMVFGRFRVEGPDGERSYDVQIRDALIPVNRCSCPDFHVNMLGTCKHIEAVLHRARKSAGRKFDKLSRTRPEIARVAVRRDDHPRVVLLPAARPSPEHRRIEGRFFDAGGVLASDPRVAIPRIQEWSRRIPDLVVDEDVRVYLDQILCDDSNGSREEEIRREVAAAGSRLRGFRGQLYPYQVEGAAFLAGRGSALLADDMGLGKTVQAIAAALHLRGRGDVERVLIVCPASLKHQWAKEIERFGGIEPCVIWGGPKERRHLYARRAPFTIVNYELVIRDEKLVAELDPDLLILDEAQRIKNWRTKTADRVKRIPARQVFVLTGTPLENRLDDLYSLLQAVEPRVLGPLWAFNHRFFKPVESRAGNARKRPRGIGHRNLDELRRRIRPIVLRRTREKVLTQLPERIENRFYLELTPALRSFMEEGVQAAATIAARAEKRPLTPAEEKQLFAAIQRARLACNAGSLVDDECLDSPKLDELTRILEDFATNGTRKAVIFSEWERMIRMAAEKAREIGLGHELLCGRVPTKKRGALLDRFRDDPDCRLLFSTDAGGVGLNLQCADTVINLELPFNPARLDQRIARVHRLGQKRPTHVILLISERSIETGIERSLTRKKELFEEVLSENAMATELDSVPGLLRAIRPVLETLDPESFPPDAEERLDAARDDDLSEGKEAPPRTEQERREGERAAEGLFRNAYRKLAAANALVDAGIPGEAFGRVRESLEAAIRAVAPEGAEELPPTRLLHEVLLPAGLVSFDAAALLASAIEVERAYGASDAQPPTTLVSQMLDRASALLADLPDGPRAR